MERIAFVVAFAGLLAYAGAQHDPNMPEDRSTIVHLFEWKWLDIADECENFLQQKGYGGVQVSPVNENLILADRPWYERYQPVSYVIQTRSGSEADFLEMTTRCNNAGVRIYVDIILNHMTGGSGIGTAGNVADYEGKHYPAVPYYWEHFNTDCEITDWQNPEQVRNCELLQLRDLSQAGEHVRERIVNFLNRLIALGVTGFRVDAAKHMWPIDLDVIFKRVNDLNTDFGFAPGTRPFIFQEVIDYDSEPNRPISVYHYNHVGAVTEFKHGMHLSRVFVGDDSLMYLDSWGPGWGLMTNSSDALVFIDNHDTQRDSDVLTYKNSRPYKMAIAFMLAHTYGHPRIMSSFAFDYREQGPPADLNGNIISPGFNADQTCTNGWVCEHRWRQIYNMVGFRNAVRGTEITNWWSGGAQQIAFCRGDRGFVAFTNGGDINENLPVCVPPGTYCDVIRGNLENGSCTGSTVTVNSDSTANIVLSSSPNDDGVLAIHVNARL